MLLAFLLFAFPNHEFISEVYEPGFNIGPLATEQCYGCDSFCEVSARPLYSGELEGLPLYEIFEPDLCNLVGFEFRKLYYTEKPYKLDCGCDAPLSSSWMGYSISLTERQKIIFDIFSTCDLFD